MRAFKAVPKSFQQLRALANPEQAGQGEAIPHVLFHEKTYTTAVTTQLTFFDAVEADGTLGNMEAAGSLPDPQFFEVYGVGCDIMRTPTLSAGVVAGALNDIELLLKAGRALWELNISNKLYQRIPLTFLHASGGAVGTIAATLTAPANLQAANNGIFDGGWPVSGTIVIPPKVGFSSRIIFAAAQALTANVNFRLWMAGVLHRRVL